MQELVLEVSLLVLLILFVRKIFTGKISYRAIYALWLLVVLRLAVPVNFVSTPISMWNFTKLEQSAGDVRQNDLNQNNVILSDTKQNAVKSYSKSQETTENYQHQNNVDESNKKVGNANESNIWQKNVDQNAIENEEVNQNADAKKSGKRQSYTKGVAGFVAKIFTGKVLHSIWIVIAALFFMVVFISNITLCFRLKRNRIFIEEMGGIGLYRSKCVGTPCLYGFFRPAIYLPDNVCLSEEELSQVVTHEWVHYKHCDYIWAAIRVLLVSIYWFHPLVWVAAVYSKKDAELACDESAIAILGEEQRFRYGETLIKLARRKSFDGMWHPVISMSNRGKVLEKRIRALSEKKKYSKWILGVLAVIVVVICGVTFSGAWMQSEKKSKESTIESAEGTSTGVVKNSENNSETLAEENCEELYLDFLKKQVDNPSCQYYSFVEELYGVENSILLTTEKVSEIEEGVHGTSQCNIYNIVDGKVTLCGEISCSSSEEWIHIIDRDSAKLLVNSHHSVTKAWVINGTTIKKQQLVEKTKENGSFAYGIYDEKNKKTTETADSMTYQDWQAEFESSPSVVFHKNIYATEDGKKANTLKYNGRRFLKFVGKSNLLYYYADLTRDGIDEKIEVNLSKATSELLKWSDVSIKIYSGKTKKVIWTKAVSVNADIGGDGVYLYLGKAEKRPSLLIWNPEKSTGIASYRWKFMELSESGKEKVIASDKIEFEMDKPKEGDIEKLEKFVRGINHYLMESQVILSGFEGDNITGVAYNRSAEIYNATEDIAHMKELLKQE